MAAIQRTLLLATALVLTLTGCSSPSSDAAMDSSDVASSSEAITEPVTTTPFGGQCADFGPAVLKSTQAFMITGAAYFYIGDDKLQQQVWDAGFDNLADWIAQTEEVVPVLKAIDTTLVTPEEDQQIQSLITAFTQQGSMSYGMFEALRIKDTDWFTSTYNGLIEVGAACDGQW